MKPLTACNYVPGAGVGSKDIPAVRPGGKYARVILVCLAAPAMTLAQSPPDAAASGSSGISNDRILGIIPNFQTVSDPNEPYKPLRIREKWWLFVKETIDPYTFASAAGGAAISQIHDDDPKYGRGFGAYSQRFGAAQADLTTQNFFSDAVLAPLFREDPRYFRMGPGNAVKKRIFYAMSRVVITRRDSGRDSFNFSGIMGMGMGIALSDAYYPRQSVGGGELESRADYQLQRFGFGESAAGVLARLQRENGPYEAQEAAPGLVLHDHLNSRRNGRVVAYVVRPELQAVRSVGQGCGIELIEERRVSDSLRAILRAIHHQEGARGIERQVDLTRDGDRS